MFTLEQASRFYDVDVVDFERPEYERDGRGLLVAVGSGIGLATMDACPAFRWLVDADSLRPSARLGDFLILAERSVSQIGLVGSFQIAVTPTQLRSIVADLRSAPLVYSQLYNLETPREVRTLRDFVRAALEIEASSRGQT